MAHEPRNSRRLVFLEAMDEWVSSEMPKNNLVSMARPWIASNLDVVLSSLYQTDPKDSELILIAAQRGGLSFLRDRYGLHVQLHNSKADKILELSLR